MFSLQLGKVVIDFVIKGGNSSIIDFRIGINSTTFKSTWKNVIKYIIKGISYSAPQEKEMVISPHKIEVSHLAIVIDRLIFTFKYQTIPRSLYTFAWVLDKYWYLRHFIYSSITAHFSIFFGHLDY